MEIEQRHLEGLERMVNVFYGMSNSKPRNEPLLLALLLSNISGLYISEADDCIRLLLKIEFFQLVEGTQTYTVDKSYQTIISIEDIAYMFKEGITIPVFLRRKKIEKLVRKIEINNY